MKGANAATPRRLNSCHLTTDQARYFVLKRIQIEY